jgi:competence protein ComEA
MAIRIRSRAAAAVILVPLAATAVRADAPATVSDRALRAREIQSLQAVCGKCHNLQLVTSTPRSLDDWRDTMQKMVDRGARGTDDQFDDILDFLNRTVTTIDVNSADADELAIVLAVSEATAQRIIDRRRTRKLANVSDLKGIPGVDAAAVDSKSKLLYFQ